MLQTTDNALSNEEEGTNSVGIAPAKINLFFEVLGKRSDGFHEICSIALPIQPILLIPQIQPIRLFDTLTFQTTAKNDICLTIKGNSIDVPDDERNIVVRALLKIQEHTGVSYGAVVELFKRIPIQAGLGGGSSDAVEALRLARDAWKLNLSDDELCAISAQIGSDCPIFFHRTATLSSGHGETIQPLPRLRKHLRFVVFKPSEGLSTAEVYRHCMQHHDGKIRSVHDFLTEWNSDDIERIGKALFNRLEIPARALWNRFDEVQSVFDNLGCLGVRMSGSGTAFYGLCRSRRHVESVVRQLHKRSSGGEQIFAVETF